MPWCPKCGAEYVENVRKCKDCDVRLLDHKPTPDEMLPPDPKPTGWRRFVSRERFLRVLKTLIAILLALAAALLFLYNLFYLSLQLYLSSPAPARYSQTPSNTAFFSKLTHSLDSPAARGRLCLLLLWISCVFCLDSWILSGIINSAMEICLTLTAGVLFWLFFPSLRLASNHPHSLL